MQQSDSKMMQSTKIQTTAEISKKKTLRNFSMSNSKKLSFKNNLRNFSVKNLNHKKKYLWRKMHKENEWKYVKKISKKLLQVKLLEIEREEN